MGIHRCCGGRRSAVEGRSRARRAVVADREGVLRSVRVHARESDAVQVRRAHPLARLCSPPGCLMLCQAPCSASLGCGAVRCGAVRIGLGASRAVGCADVALVGVGARFARAVTRSSPCTSCLLGRSTLSGASLVGARAPARRQNPAGTVIAAVNLSPVLTVGASCCRHANPMGTQVEPLWPLHLPRRVWEPSGRCRVPRPEGKYPLPITSIMSRVLLALALAREEGRHAVMTVTPLLQRTTGGRQVQADHGDPHPERCCDRVVAVRAVRAQLDDGAEASGRQRVCSDEIHCASDDQSALFPSLPYQQARAAEPGAGAAAWQVFLQWKPALS